MSVAGKNVEISFFDATAKLLNYRAFESGQTMDDLLENYFVDFSLMPLMIQENYLKLTPVRAQRHPHEDKTSMELQYLMRAADSISDGDLCSAMIHGCAPQTTFVSLSFWFLIFFFSFLLSCQFDLSGAKSGRCFRCTACSLAFGQPPSAMEPRQGRTASEDLTSLLGNFFYLK